MRTKILTAFLAFILAFGSSAFVACSVNNDSSSVNSGSSSSNSSDNSQSSDTSSSGNNGENNMEIDRGDKDNPTYLFFEDGLLLESSVKKSESIYKLNATDDYGRSVDYMCGYKTDKKRYVGLMYFLWLGWHGGEMSGIYDNSKLLDEDPNSLWDTNGTSASPIGKYHFWGEPLYGYYDSRDPWVIRKQVELFIMSGIDFLCFDCTNGFEYIDVVSVLLPILQEYYDAGWNVPKFMFYTNSNSAEIVKRLYYGTASATHNPIEENGLYKGGYYKDLWFAPEGKPRIAAIIDSNHNWSETNPSGSVITDSNILNFFDFWESQWPNSGYVEKGLPWMDWNRPQLVHNDTINVSVAQHNLLPFSDALLSEDLADLMYGRGYTTANGADHSDDGIESAANFNEEWSVALEKDCKYTLVTGWNEWVALKNAMSGMNAPYISGKRVYFVDAASKEYSRDLEMMKGGYKDNYYLSLMRNIRSYKGDTSTEMPVSSKTAINIKQGLEQWNEATDVFYGIKTINRDFKNFANTANYTDNSLRNDIEQIRVTHDDENIYFMVKCFDDIVAAPETNNWMNLLIDVEGQKNDNSFYGYDYVVNRLSSYTGECGVETLNYKKQTLTYTLGAKANFTLNGKYMQYRISKKALGISGSFKINFKFADNVAEPDNIESYYVSGDCAPVGRLNYTFKG